MAAALVGTVPSLQAQSELARPIGPGCAAWGCEEAVMHAAALDSLAELRDTVAGLRARVLSTLHIDPFTQLDGTRAPAAARISTAVVQMARARNHDVELVALDTVVSGASALRPGPPLVIFNPIDWLGPDRARLRAAVYSHDVQFGGLYIVTLVRGPSGWSTERVAVEWQKLSSAGEPSNSCLLRTKRPAVE